MTSSVLITGGFGNIGSRFASFLNEKRFDTIRLTSRKDRTAPQWAPSAQVVQADVQDFQSLRQACEGIDVIFHFAALNDRECQANPALAHAVNVIGTQNLARAAEESGTSHFVYASTAHVYGSPLVGVIDELSPTQPTHPYGKTHLDAEQSLRDWASVFELTILRCGNGIGFPLTHEVDIWHNFVNDLCVQAVKDRELIIKSPPNIERNFVTLEDFCRAFYFFGIERLNSTGHRVFNLGSKMSRTLLEMAELIASQTQSLFGFRPTIRLESEPSRHETRLVYDSRRLETTGFQLNESFEKEISGILRFVSETNV